MHAYDVPRRLSPQPIPAARSAQDLSTGSSATPIYDALYAEYVRSFRACPGDRSGEEDLDFVAFSHPAHRTGAYGTRHAAPQHATGRPAAPHGQSSTATVWERVARQATVQHLPALPPAPRRGL
ncbi:hypothetical protein [Streptomyces sp. NPDC007264]|uniref:hypothetical protein n=1 Tax=Streptomyces sp. NPDC007264 TaxID=3364777 RepID=UPI0036DBADC1